MDAAHLAGIVRAADRDRYLADLYAPAAVRPHLFALNAFDVEVARIPFLVREPQLGEIRLQWWRDALHGDGEGHPVAAALTETIKAFSLPIAAFDNLLAARVFDLYHDPMPGLAALEGYAGETASAIMQLAAIILNGGNEPGTSDLAGYAGVAATILRVLARLPRDAAARRLYVPADLLSATGTDPEDIFDGRTTDRLRSALAELRAIARRRAGEALALIATVPAATRPAFLPLALVEPELAAMERPGFDPLRDTARLSAWRRQWILGRTARRWA